MNHVLHMAAINQLREDIEGRVYFGTKSQKARPVWKRRALLKRELSDVLYRRLAATEQT